MQKRFCCILKNKNHCHEKNIYCLTAIALFMSCKNENKSDSIAEVTTTTEKDREPQLQKEQSKNDFIGDIRDTITAPQEDGRNKAKKNQQILLAKQDWDKKIIKTANLNLEVRDYNAYNSLLRDKLKQFGG